MGLLTHPLDLKNTKCPSGNRVSSDALETAASAASVTAAPAARCTRMPSPWASPGFCAACSPWSCPAHPLCCSGRRPGTGGILGRSGRRCCSRLLLHSLRQLPNCRGNRGEGSFILSQHVEGLQPKSIG